ncbi:hypothetical protein HSBAA_10080 [Vreelandella sulfidaeris]|uniref:Selenoprotein O n=1 Tax=Vreelandella sulfidaeris TaxID=115553 RepID=A0A455U159_9GAMM|nr:hypothetical protein HSBAA_10080 [Halomonas sulfidaeris]
MLREYLVSEFMAAMGIPTTRALAAVTSGERVVRQMSEPGAVFTRVASSHIRVGTFQFAAAQRDEALLKALADHVIDRHYPEAANAEDPYMALLEAVVARQAVLIARWMSVGFIHGVMNTDNCSIAGETIDYGPAPLWSSSTRRRYTAPSIKAAATPLPTSRRLPSGTWPALPKRCCR